MESISVLNQRLIDYFGIDSSTGQPMFKIVWANSQLEKRRVEHSDAGIQFLYPTVMEVKKYPYIKDMYVLERLVAIPEMNKDDLPTAQLSYEPIWTYRTDKDEAVLPAWEPTKFVIDTLYAALGKKSLRKYVESEKFTTKEGQEQRIAEIHQELFGNETETGDALAHGEAIVVPRNYGES